jgi:hypothetical protein
MCVRRPDVVPEAAPRAWHPSRSEHGDHPRLQATVVARERDDVVIAKRDGVLGGRTPHATRAVASAHNFSLGLHRSAANLWVQRLALRRDGRRFATYSPRSESAGALPMPSVAPVRRITLPARPGSSRVTPGEAPGRCSLSHPYRRLALSFNQPVTRRAWRPTAPARPRFRSARRGLPQCVVRSPGLPGFRSVAAGAAAAACARPARGLG